MGEPTNVYGVIACGINMGSILILGILGWWFNRRLRWHPPEVYESIGTPSFMNNSPAQQLQYTRFLFSSEWKRLSDPALIIGYFALRILYCACLIVFVTVMVMFLRGDFRPTKEHPRFGSLDQHNSMTPPRNLRVFDHLT